MENKPTKLTLEHYDTMTWEGGWDAGIEDIMNGLVGCLAGCGFYLPHIYAGIRDWLDEHDPVEVETGED